MKDLAIIGGGGHAVSLLDILPPGRTTAGYVDMSPSPMMQLPYLGSDDDFLKSAPQGKLAVAITFVSGRDCSLSSRRVLLDKYRDMLDGSIVAPTAIVSATASLAKGTQVFHRAVINARATVGTGSIINTGAIVEHGCRIGDNVFIGPGAIVCGGVSIGDNCYIGAGATIRPGTTITADTIIGLGAAVVKDIDHPGTYAGNPAKLIPSRK